MATTAQRLALAEAENERQKAQIDILEAKLILVLDYLDQRVVDRLNKIEKDLNRVAIGAMQLRTLASIFAEKTRTTEHFQNMAHPLSFIGDTINTSLDPEYPLAPRTELEAQIVSPPITPAPEEPEA